MSKTKTAEKIPTQVIRVEEVATMCSVAKSTVWKWNKLGLIPKPFKLTPSTTVWRLSEIMDWLDEKQRESNADTQIVKTV